MFVIPFLALTGSLRLTLRFIGKVKTSPYGKKMEQENMSHHITLVCIQPSCKIRYKFNRMLFSVLSGVCST